MTDDLTCRTCGATVPPKIPGTRGSQSWYCSTSCRRAAVNRDVPTSCRVFITDCGTCGSVFASRYTTSTCSPSCAATKKREDKQEHKHRRRARQRDAYVAPVSRRLIYERDDYRCHLCKRKVLVDQPVPHPRAAVLDHVIPLASGGTHEPANVRTACFMCNCIKGVGGGNEQLLLIG